MTGPPVHLWFEASGWSVAFPGTPVAADGATLAEAVDDAVIALRDYAEDWMQRLGEVPNHRHQWPLVEWVSLRGDGELRAWLLFRAVVALNL